MSVEKNITMRQFNGTDYDTLYPKTDVKQIENLTPSSIGAVAKSGDTMTGALGINGVSSPNLYNIGNNWFGLQAAASDGVNDIRLFIANESHSSLQDAVHFYWKNALGQTKYSLLHTGNAQSLGYPKIAIGSYVGTGTYGSSNPNTLTFDFEPKIVFLSVDSSASAFSQTGFMFFIRNQSGSPSWYFYNVAYVGRTITWSGNTLSWYTLTGNPNDAPDRQQFNVSGQRYCYVALG